MDLRGHVIVVLPVPRYEGGDVANVLLLWVVGKFNLFGTN